MSVNAKLSKRLLELMTKTGLISDDLPISEPELHRKLHDTLSATEREELHALLREAGKLEAMV